MPSLITLPRLSYLLCLPLLLQLAGCELPSLPPDPKVVQREAEAKAIGSACRHALRGLEDCYTLNPSSAKAQVFAGWREMDEYMREHKIEGTPSVLTQMQPPTAPTPTRKKRSTSEDGDEQTSTPRSRS